MFTTCSVICFKCDNFSSSLSQSQSISNGWLFGFVTSKASLILQCIMARHQETSQLKPISNTMIFLTTCSLCHGYCSSSNFLRQNDLYDVFVISHRWKWFCAFKWVFISHFGKKCYVSLESERGSEREIYMCHRCRYLCRHLDICFGLTSLYFNLLQILSLKR